MIQNSNVYTPSARRDILRAVAFVAAFLFVALVIAFIVVTTRGKLHSDLQLKRESYRQVSVSVDQIVSDAHRNALRCVDIVGPGKGFIFTQGIVTDSDTYYDDTNHIAYVCK